MFECEVGRWDLFGESWGGWGNGRNSRRKKWTGLKIGI